MQSLHLAPFLAGALASAASAGAMHSMRGAPSEWTAFGEPGRAADRTIAITITNTHYRPDAVAIRRGETVRFVVTNRGKVTHEFVIGDSAFQARHQWEMAQMPGMTMNEPNELTLPPGQTRSLAWRFSRAGAFFYECDFPGHAQAGMVGHIHVR